MSHLYAGSVLKINLNSGVVSSEPTGAYTESFLGGRGINIKLFYDHISPGVDPLSPENVLVFGVGPLGGTSISSGRTEVTAKSPETGLLGSTNFGGFFGGELKFAGYDHILIEGKAEEPVYIWIENERIEIREASSIWGLDTYEAPEAIRSEVGNPEAKVVCIGPAGEKLVRFSSVQHELGHGGGRTGLGAVMGSKNLKAIAVRGTKSLTLADPLGFLALAEEFRERILNDPGIIALSQGGYAEDFDAHVSELKPYAMTLSPSKDGTDNDVPSLSAIYTKFDSKRAGCYGCPVQCMDHYQAGGGKSGVISCEMYSAFTHYVRCFDSDTSLECSILCQRYGMDAVSTGAIIGWLMDLHEKGIISEADTDGIPMQWGNPNAIRSTVDKIAHRKGIGDMLAEGILRAAEKLGRGAADFANQTKGLPMVEVQSPEWTPYLKGGALATAVGPRGDSMRSLASHDASRPESPVLKATLKLAGVDENNEAQSYEGKPELVAMIEDIVILNDLLSTCKWLGGWVLTVLTQDQQAAWFSAGSGRELSVEDLFTYAKRVRTLERAYEAGEGLTRESDTLPKAFFDNPIKSGPWKGAVLERERFEEMKSRFYTLRGWDPATGIPTEETLVELGLTDVAEDLMARGILASSQ